MSSFLEKLEFQNLRSYGAKTVINFQRPLNLIVGINGSGKTTIIEVLKYALTGSCPPPDKNGFANFVRDPKATGAPSMAAYVKLQFRDRHGHVTTVHRALDVAVKKGSDTVSFKTHLSSICSCDASGKTTTLTSKCTDINEAMVSFFAVPPSVIDSVLFAHQDESNWPFESSAALKDRFDEIFAATHYRKALAVVKEQAKTHEDQLPLLAKDLEACARAREQLADLTVRAEAGQREIALKLAEIVALEAEQSRTDNELAEQRAAAKATEGLRAERDAARATFSARQALLADQHARLEIVFEETDAELAVEAHEYRARVAAADANVRALVDAQARRDRAVELLQADCRRLQGDKGRLEAESDAQTRRVADRAARIVAAARELDVPLAGAATDETVVGGWLAELARAVDGATARLNVAVADAQAADDRAAADVLALSSALTEHDMARRAALAARAERESELAGLRRERAAHASAGASVAELQAALAHAEEDDARLRPLVAPSGLESVARAADARVAAADAEVAAATDALSRASAASALGARLVVLEQSLAERAARLDALLAEHAGALRLALGGGAVPAAALVDDRVQAKLDELEASLRAGDQRAATARASYESAAREASNAQAAATALAAALASDETAVAEQTARFGGLPVAEVIARTEARHAELTQRVQSAALFQSLSRTLYTEHLTAARETRCCPMCSRGFGADEPAFARFVDALASSLAKLSTDDSGEAVRAKALADIGKADATLRGLRDIETLVKRRDDLARRVPEAAALADVAAAAAARAASELAAADAAVEAPRRELGALRAVREPSRLVAAEARQVAELTASVASERARVGAGGSGAGAPPSAAAVDALTARVRALKSDATAARARATELATELAARRAEARAVESRVHALRADLARASAAAQARDAVGLRIDGAEAALADAERQASDADAASGPLRARIEARRREKDVARAASDAHIQQLRAAAKARESAHQQLAAASRAIAEHATRHGDGAGAGAAGGAAAIVAHIAAREAELEEATRVRRAEADALERHRAELAQKRTTEAAIEANLAYRREAAAVHALGARADAADAALAAALGDRQVERALERLERRRDELLREHSRAKGVLEQLGLQLADVETQLAREPMRNASAAYAAKQIEQVTCEALVRDLKRYALALDAALLRYHTLKMAQVNQTIEGLWRAVYKGADIDTIAIRADTETKAKKASYNYRMVIRRGDYEMPARGRCSAGQKVLASLIVRLALAEAFAAKTSVICLDEPTTNLDRRTTASFAHELARLVAERRNMQMIVITHDKTFIRDLAAAAGEASGFLHVRKDTRGWSCIERKDFASL